ncbi:ATP binding protein [Aureococcus anophagefferens]|nr:ATP binding protein [Aureococcus anophagefferens]
MPPLLGGSDGETSGGETSGGEASGGEASGGETSGGEASAGPRRGLRDEASGDEAPAPDAPARRGGAPDGAADGSSSSDGDSSGFDDDGDDATTRRRRRRRRRRPRRRPRFRCLGLADALLPRGDPRSDAVFSPTGWRAWCRGGARRRWLEAAGDAAPRALAGAAPAPLRGAAVFSDVSWIARDLAGAASKELAARGPAGADVLWATPVGDYGAPSAPRTACPSSTASRDWYHPATYELRCGAEALAALRHAEAHPGAWWISKPRAGSRGRGCASASLAPALAVGEACPRVAQRYVRDVALYRGRKFDVRFLVLVRRLEGDALCGRLWRDFWAGIKQ